MHTSAGVDPSDEAVIEIWSGGLEAWEVLERFTGIRGSRWFRRSYDVSRYLWNDTRVRFRVVAGYATSGERFEVDYVESNVTGRDVAPGSVVDLEVSRGRRPNR